MALARHRFCTGQETQPGDLGVQTVAPNSIIPWLKSAGWSGSTISSAKLLNIPKTNFNCTLFKLFKLIPCKFNDFTVHVLNLTIFFNTNACFCISLPLYLYYWYIIHYMMECYYSFFTTVCFGLVDLWN